MKWGRLFPACCLFALLISSMARAQPAKDTVEYRVLATNKTSTMQKEMQDAAAAGFRFGGVMGGDTAFGGSEVVVVMVRDGAKQRFDYRLLATNKTSTMQKELSEGGGQGFSFVGLTVAETAIGGAEVVAILRRRVP